MRWHIYASAFSLALSACGVQQVEELSISRVNEIKAVVGQKFSAARLLAICGASRGKFLWLDQPRKGFNWQSDGIEDGAIVFIRDAVGPNVIIKDASLNFGDLRSDGASIAVVREDKSRPLISTWVVTYGESGIVQTHNLARNQDGKLVDIWTSNKPAAFGSPRAFVFTSYCVEA